MSDLARDAGLLQTLASVFHAGTETNATREGGQSLLCAAALTRDLQKIQHSWPVWPAPPQPERLICSSLNDANDPSFTIRFLKLLTYSPKPRRVATSCITFSGGTGDAGPQTMRLTGAALCPLLSQRQFNS